MAKYRLIKRTNYFCAREPWVRYVIQKKCSFFFWKWWSEDYLYGPEGCFEYNENERDVALKNLAILNGEKPWIMDDIIAIAKDSVIA